LTQGFEFNSSFRLGKLFQIQIGYQFLKTADKEDLRDIRAGKVFTRDLQTNVTRKVSRRDYAGLPSRSVHSANAKLFYENENKGWSASLRMFYRGRWGTYDKDGNGIINRKDEFAEGSAMIHLMIQKSIEKFSVQAGVMNLLNYKDLVNLPAEPGIQPYISIKYSIINHKTEK
jgi:outer membrane receptor for ferrienterochelin and colicins